MGRHLAAVEDPRGSAQVLNARVGARADEHLVNLDLLDGRVRLETHVLERVCPFAREFLARSLGWIRHLTGDGHGVLRTRAPRHGRRNVLGINFHDLVVLGARVTRE